MSTLPPNTLDRLYELLGERQNGTLTEAMAVELDQLLASPEARAAEADFERTQAAMLLAFKDNTPARMPADAMSRLEAIGVGMVAPASVKRGGMSMGWLAAAIVAVVAVVGWMRSPTPGGSPTTLTDAQKLAVLVTDPETKRVPLAAQKDPAAQGVTGEVVWNNARQQGYLRLKGLAQNDPSKEQYQLWIFDASRETYPIDGGVFDVKQASIDPASGDTIIPMRPALSVGKPAAFAITIEKPGGVVVTTKERLLLLGAAN